MRVTVEIEPSEYRVFVIPHLSARLRSDRFRPLVALGVWYLALGLVLRLVLWWSFGRAQQVAAAELPWIVSRGLASDAMQALYTGIKLPLVILLSSLGNSLLNGMLAPLLGLNLTFRQSLLMVLMTFAIAAAFLLHGMRRLGLGFLAAALVVTFSRVYIGTHYASDVLGGALTGIVAAAVVRSVYWEGTRADRFITGIL